MKLRIPKGEESVFSRFVAYTQAQADAIFAALEGGRPALRVTDLSSLVGPVVGVPEEELADLFRAVGGLYLILDRKETSLDALIEDVLKALGATGNPQLKLEGLALDSFRDRLRKLLSFEKVLGVTAKALDVLSEQERFFCQARILTDIRPVFPLRSEESPAGFVLIHTLRITYHQAGGADHKDFHLALDGAGLEELEGVLERAKRKEETLRGLLKGKGLLAFEVTDACGSE